MYVCLCTALAVAAQAQSWQFVGSRAMGMGGASVATAYGPDAQYWNPAGLAQEEDLNETGFLLNLGAELQATKDTLDGVSGLTDLSKQYKNLKTAIDNSDFASAENLSTVFKGLNDISKLLNNKSGALVNANGGLGLKIKNFSVSARALGSGAIRPVVDTNRILLNNGSGLKFQNNTATPPAAYVSAAQALAKAIDDNGIFGDLNTLLGTSYANSTAMANDMVNTAIAYGGTEADILKALGAATDNVSGASEIIKMAGSATDTYSANQTLAMADAATFGEVSLGYGSKIIPGLKLGANLKVIDGYTAQSGVMILKDDQKIKDILDKAYDNKKSSVNFGIDLGAMVNFAELLDKEMMLNPQVGLTVKNLNNPKFDRPDIPAGIDPAIAAQWNTNKYQLKPQLRAGAAINPVKNLTLAADVDLTENDTLISGIKSRQLALGAEINVFNRPKFHIPLRFGYNTNLAESDMSDFVTAGVGLNMLHFYIELAGAFSFDTTKFDDTTVPNSAAASLSLGFLF